MSSSHPQHADAVRGVGFAFGAYLCWGLFPLYWKPLAAVSALEILAHRIVWSALLLAVLLVALGTQRVVLRAFRQPRVLALFAASSLCLSINWLAYIWAVNHERVVEASLGYYINPLMNVALGALFLHERLSRVQKAAIALAAAGVAWLSFGVGQVPWIALLLAVTFALYGLLRKTAKLASLEGLALETFLLAPWALAGLAALAGRGEAAILDSPPATVALLVGAGLVTTVPLLFFAGAARRLKLATLGVIQYLSPTIQFLLGVWLYHEPLGAARLAGFVLIWGALLLYSVAGWRDYKRQPARPAAKSA
ncbi:chloramphenicol-sensitive protein RarD [Crenobacter luteus]|uniref:EamA family transporter RarD n=1 Tax=Crenobacter luteus TaxID=1452487 RepID=UPI0010488A7C|nr:EamA family transporter RarD [Crenobacter luteus]TCP10247.1 chloramphenicol-sensitive protein RarD [Crenobacter luteus]